MAALRSKVAVGLVMTTAALGLGAAPSMAADCSSGACTTTPGGVTGPAGGTSSGTGTSPLWPGGGDPTGLARHFGNVGFDKQYGIINTNGAPFVYADLVCMAPWLGGVAEGSIGNPYAACNPNSAVNQMKTGGLIG
ncbi:hypothetical protein ACMATS_05900 [Streptoverticillium reticulum]|uniref:hypothetical protein n=1 Tax=Streptoverticillium reticulum TaxID=1433415 RepID=UPI0039BFB3CA